MLQTFADYTQQNVVSPLDGSASFRFYNVSSAEAESGAVSRYQRALNAGSAYNAFRVHVQCAAPGRRNALRRNDHRENPGGDVQMNRRIPTTFCYCDQRKEWHPVHDLVQDRRKLLAPA